MKEIRQLREVRAVLDRLHDVVSAPGHDPAEVIRLLNIARSHCGAVINIRDNYRAVMQALGLPPRIQAHVNFEVFHPSTTLMWRFPEIDRCIAWVWFEALEYKTTKYRHDLPRIKRERLMADHVLDLCATVFGIHQLDISGQRRTTPIAFARLVVARVNYKLGASLATCCRTLNKKADSMRNTIKITEHLLETITDAKSFSDFRPAPNEQSRGRLQTQAYGYASRGNRQARVGLPSHLGRSYGRKGQAPGGTGEHDRGPSGQVRADGANAGDDGQS